jgi:hypothetical protein
MNMSMVSTFSEAERVEYDEKIEHLESEVRQLQYSKSEVGEMRESQADREEFICDMRE